LNKPELPRPPLCLITDESLGATDIVEKTAAALGAGCRLVQLRDRRLGTRPLLDLARRLRDLSHRHQALLVVNDRIDIALAVAADGVHLPAAGMATAAARALVGPLALVGRSVHSPGEVAACLQDGADYVHLGPIFDTPSKRAFGKPLGLEILGEAAREAKTMPVFAVGGIKSGCLKAVIRAGATGAAVISAVMEATDPAQASALLVGALEEALGRQPKSGRSGA
jgi:thiamine-phosphate pyrophosphorylase